MTDQVHVQLIAIDVENAANNQLLWDLSGDPMECHDAGARWVKQAAAADPDRADVYGRFLDRISGLADQPPPESGFTIIINPPLGLLWSVTWPWAPRPASSRVRGVPG